jgi:hypothetical protein
MQASVKDTDCNKPFLAVIGAGVRINDGAALLDIRRPVERKTSLFDVPGVLGAVKGDVHDLNVVTKK